MERPFQLLAWHAKLTSRAGQYISNTYLLLRATNLNQNLSRLRIQATVVRFGARLQLLQNLIGQIVN